MKKELKFDVIVTRHKGLLQYLKELDLVNDTVEVIEHANKSNIKGKNVCGVLPHSLSSLTNTFTEIPLSLPLELRGKELTYEEVKMYSGKPITYKVREVK